MTENRVTYRSGRGRAALAASIIGSGMAFLDSTVTNVALPEIGADFDVGFTAFQWVVNSYMLTLSALLLLGGSLGDLFGRRRMFIAGVAGFGVASLLVGLAPGIEVLIAARLLQGISAALLTPASLAMLQGGFVEDDRPAAIGAWSGFSGLSTILGPLLGGFLIDTLSWRWAFLINPPLALIAILLARRHVPETLDEDPKRPDVAGASLATVALAGVIFALIQGPETGWGNPWVVAAAATGVAMLAAFLVVETRIEGPMLPLDIFRSRQFSGANLATLLIYFSLSGVFFLVALQLRENLGYTALEAGVAGAPVTILLLVLSPQAGKAMVRVGPRPLMTVGPIIAGVGTMMLVGVSAGSSYWTSVLPGMTVFGIGLGITVAPLTATALGAVEDRRAGIASAVNNTVARAAGLLAVPLLPLAAGISGVADGLGAAFSEGFGRAMVVAGALCIAGGVVSWSMIRRVETEAPAPPRSGDR